MRRILRFAERHYNGAMLSLFCAVVIFAVTLYTEGVVDRLVIYPDGHERACGTAFTPSMNPDCLHAWLFDDSAAAVAFVLLLATVAAMVVLRIRRSRRAF